VLENIWYYFAEVFAKSSKLGKVKNDACEVNLPCEASGQKVPTKNLGGMWREDPYSGKLFNNRPISAVIRLDLILLSSINAGRSKLVLW
jgi:hypothetical protein